MYLELCIGWSPSLQGFVLWTPNEVSMAQQGWKVKNETREPTFFSDSCRFVLKEKNIQSQCSWQICAPSTVLKPFLGHFSQVPTVLRFRSRFTKLKSLSGESSFVFLSYESPVVALWLLSSRPSFQSLPSKHWGTFLSPNCPLVFGKALKRSHLWSMFSNRMCLCCFAVCVL